MFDIDLGGSGGSQGPWISWQARESLDGAIPGRAFVLRDSDGKRVFEGFEKGIVFDLENLKTGWCYSSGAAGQAPDWKWNASLARFEPSPGEDWKRGFSIPVALSKSDTAVWEQAQAGAFQAFVALVQQIKTAGAPKGKLPVVRWAGTDKLESKKGVTHVPRLEIVKWVDRPAALSVGAIIDAGDDDFPGTVTPKAEPPKQPALVDDDEF
jgi:hypothetical protein